MNRDTLLSSIHTHLEADQRVLAAWLSGSLARGDGDEYSDIDLWVVVDDTQRDAFLADWPATADRISPSVLQSRVNAGPTVVLNHITPGWLRFDLAVGSPAQVPQRSRATLKLLFDRAGLDAQLMPAGPILQPSPARVSALTTEFLRVLGLLPVVLGRDELVVAASGSGLIRGLVVQLMLEDVAVEDRGGALNLSRVLPPERLAALAALPAIEATRQSAIAVHLACAQLFLPLARELCERTGTRWPAELHDALREHLRRELNIDLID